MKERRFEFEELKDAFRKVIKDCPNPYARAYALAGLELDDEEALRVQAGYVLSNLGGWKEKDVIRILKRVSGTEDVCEICGAKAEVEIEGEQFCRICAENNPVQTCRKCGARTSHGDFIIAVVHLDGSECDDPERCDDEHVVIKKYFLCDNCL